MTTPRCDGGHPHPHELTGNVFDECREEKCPPSVYSAGEYALVHPRPSALAFTVPATIKARQNEQQAFYILIMCSLNHNTHFNNMYILLPRGPSHVAEVKTRTSVR